MDPANTADTLIATFAAGFLLGGFTMMVLIIVLAVFSNVGDDVGPAEDPRRN